MVPSISDLAPLDLAVRFQDAAKATGQKLTVQQHAPVPLTKKDPLGLVQGLMLIPLLIGGYMSSTLLMAATGKAAGRWRAAQLAGFAIVAGLAVDLIVCYWLHGFPCSKFWIVWPICSLIIAVVAFVAAVLQKLIGAAGTLLTVIVMILLGNPSSGGATGVPYLPTFWRDLGPWSWPRCTALTRSGRRWPRSSSGRARGPRSGPTTRAAGSAVATRPRPSGTRWPCTWRTT